MPTAQEERRYGEGSNHPVGESRGRRLPDYQLERGCQTLGKAQAQYKDDLRETQPSLAVSRPLL